MNQDIQYSGFTAVPADYECPDGQLAVAINCIPENGALQPMLPPKRVFSASADHPRKCVYIHKSSGYEHHIAMTGENKFVWYEKDTPAQNYDIGTVSKYLSVTSVGNTLIFLTDDGMQYYLWKSNPAGYLHLGSKIPECHISFGLQGELVKTEEFKITFDAIKEKEIYNEFTDDNKTRITNQVLAHVNKFIAEESTDKGRFIFPFFVRYAYRLYDGTLTMHSSPVLMIASSDLAPQVFWKRIEGKDKYSEAELSVVGMLHKLDYAVILPDQNKDMSMLKNWSDIVRSVDIFVSKPIYTYDQNGQCTNFSASKTINSYCVCRHTNQRLYFDTKYYKRSIRYQHHTFNDLYSFTFSTSHTLEYPTGRLIIPRRSVDAVKEDIRSTATFYILKSIKIDQLKTERTILEVEEDYLKSLLTREVMTDDYDSHDTLIPHYAFAYNARINLCNINKRLYAEYNSAAMLTHSDGYIGYFSDAQPDIRDYTVGVTIYFYIRQDGKEIIVKGKSCQLAGYEAPFIFLFYPNVNAYKAVIVTYRYGPSEIYEVPLEQHNFLNGAFYFGGWDNPPEGGTIPTPYSDADRTIEIPNKIYTSEVNNPFIFPLLGINTVGTGQIKGICTASKALSQGQFGQFPLYAFSTEGVWALEVSATGTYSAKQPITRDVCINPDGITQLDSSVLFPTDRGIMLISGSQTQCISEPLNSEFPFNPLGLPGFDKLHGMIHAGQDTCLPTLPFTAFLKQCRIFYDYVHQHIIVYAPGITYAYVYSMKSQEWGMTFSNIVSHLNSYPEALAVDKDNNIVDFSHSDDHQVSCLYVTRPLKLGQGSLLKTIDTVIQRGNFARGHLATVLYGSRDLIHWHLLWSSKDHYLRGVRGTPYKFFRIAGVANLSPGENIIGASVQFTPRLTDQPR